MGLLARVRAPLASIHRALAGPPFAAGRPGGGNDNRSKTMNTWLTLRTARPEDVPELRRMHRRSMRELGGALYTPAQIEGLFLTLDTADPALVAAGRYFVAEADGTIVGSGGWGRAMPGVAATEADGPPDATIRAVFVHPAFTRRGIARRIMDVAETDAVLRGRAETIRLVATLSGLPLYRALGYRAGEAIAVALANGERFPAVPMAKVVTETADAALSG